MNINKFTQSSMAAVQACEKVAMEYGNQEVEQEHLMYALQTIEDSLILKLFEKMGVTKETANMTITVTFPRLNFYIKGRRDSCFFFLNPLSFFPF